jgi:anti-sigma regulatory factor (Ser/Thr protein kinase)
MFAVRLRVFVDWHRQQGRTVDLVPPKDPATRQLFDAMRIGDGGQAQEDDAVLPVTKMNEFSEVEEVAKRTKEILEYDLHDVSALGEATFQAVSELCGNAIEHGQNQLGAYAAVRRETEPRRQISVAISDLGMGIPEHIRQRYPEWDDDGFAIARATDEGISGTGHPHRGIGFSSTFEAALTRSLHAAQMDIRSASGLCRVQIVQEDRKIETIPGPRFQRGTWITYDLVSV